MLKPGPARKVTIYLNEDSRHHLAPLYESVLELLRSRGIAGATATRALAGFGAHRVIHTTKMELAAEHLPIRIEFVDTAEKIEAILPPLCELVDDGLIEMQDTLVVQNVRKDRAREDADLPVVVREGVATQMIVFLGEADTREGQPVYELIVQTLRRLGIAGATVHRGILGYGAKGHEHRRSFWHLSRDLPIAISVIDSTEKITAAADAIASLLEDGLITTSEVREIRMERLPMEAPSP